MKYLTILTAAVLTLTSVTAAHAQTGKASYYGPRFHGKKTASGARFNQNAMTAAHRSLPFGSKVRVTNTKTKKSVVVTINDRGPYAGGRIIDLSKGANSRLGCNLCTVKLDVLSRGNGKYQRS